MLTRALHRTDAPQGALRRRWPWLQRCGWGLGLGASALVVISLMVTGKLPVHRENIWSIAIYGGTSLTALRPLDIASMPVLTASHVSDVRASFVADPFAVWKDGRGFLFFEVMNSATRQGDIGLAVSDADGVAWTYQQIVLDEGFHLSYPHVFSEGERWYLMPESEAVDEIRLYEAVQFPTRWRHVKTLIRGPGLADPTVFRHEGRWWMFVGQSETHDRLRLFSAERLSGTWIEHPQSPLTGIDAGNARPAGPVVQTNGQLLRLAQDCRGRYGTAVNAYRIVELTTNAYREESASGSPLLEAGAAAWNNVGMHHLDAHQVDGRWWAAVDGHTKRWVWNRWLVPF